jgi:hypothetical protein
MKMVVRFEVDAFLPTKQEVQTPTSTPPASPVDLASPPPTPVGLVSPSTATPKVVYAGTVVPQSSLLELKSMKASKNSAVWWNVALPQLYLSATPNLYLGLHTRGAYYMVHKHGQLGAAAAFETLPGFAVRLWQLGALLHTLRHLAMTVGRVVPLSVVGHQGTLRVYERVSSKGVWMLPKEEMTRFEKVRY